MINTDTQRTIQRSSSWAINYFRTKVKEDLHKLFLHMKIKQIVCIFAFAAKHNVCVGMKRNPTLKSSIVQIVTHCSNCHMQAELVASIQATEGCF